MAAERSIATSHVERDPQVLSGEPIVRGTRISVRSIVLAEREFGGPAGVLIAYPHLTAAQVRDALAYYETHSGEIDRHIQENLAED